MNTACGLREHPSAGNTALRETHEPLPVRGARAHKPPLEVHAEREPWLPLREAYPELPRPLHNVTVAVVTVVAVLLTVLLLVGMVW